MRQEQRIHKFEFASCRSRSSHAYFPLTRQAATPSFVWRNWWRLLAHVHSLCHGHTDRGVAQAGHKGTSN